MIAYPPSKKRKRPKKKMKHYALRKGKKNIYNTKREKLLRARNAITIQRKKINWGGGKKQIDVIRKKGSKG